MFEAERGVFGVGLVIEMAGIASLASTLRRDAGRRRARLWCAVGVLLAGVTALVGVVTILVGADLRVGQAEALLSLVTLFWVAATGIWLTRRFA
jgi:heme A synthase